MPVWEELQDRSGPATPHNQLPPPGVGRDDQEDAAVTRWSELCQETLTSSR